MLDGGETPLLWVVKLRYTPDDLRTVRNPEAELHNGHVEAARLLIDVGKADVNAQTVRSFRLPPAAGQHGRCVGNDVLPVRSHRIHHST
jgi:hypothetical protein